MTRVGVQLGARQARAVVLTGWPRRSARAVDVPFDPERPDEAVAALRALLGNVRRMAVAIDLQLLRTKRITLPALPAAERRNIVRLEPDRFFAVRGEEIVPAVRAEDGLVFAVTAARVERWVAALEQIAPVDVVEPTPVALARALATASTTDAVVLFDGADAGIAVAEIRQGRVTRARRLFGGATLAARAVAEDRIPGDATRLYCDPWTEDTQATAAEVWPGGACAPVPGVGGVAGAYAAAYGAALAIESPPPVAETLVSATHGAAIQRRRFRDMAVAVAACATACLFALSSLDSRREREARDLEAATAALASRAAPALALQTELASLARRGTAMRAIDAERSDPLRVLRALSAKLPPGAFVRGVRGTSAGWQVDGYAPNASAVITALGADAEFRDVHFLAGTTRNQIGNRPYESFALAFRFVPAP